MSDINWLESFINKESLKTTPEIEIIIKSNKFINNIETKIEEMEVFAILKARQLGFEPGAHILLTGGVPTGVGSTNFMKILKLKAINEEML
jgi:galactokinase